MSDFKYIFKLLRSKHSQKEPVLDSQGKPVLDQDGNPKWASRIYKAGDIFRSQHDLVAKFNHPNSVKFERLPDDYPLPHVKHGVQPQPAQAPQQQPAAQQGKAKANVSGSV